MPAATFVPDDYLPQFGLRAFRPGQREVISSVLEGLDCVCIMPTGGGKSLCYQLPSIARPGTTLVVSPLIALMKDQVDGLLQRGMRAAFVNSSLSTAAQDETLARLSASEYDLLYVAPERFRSPRFLEALRTTQIQLLAVDEAHCISEWGHDFRHDYARLGEFRRQLGNPQTIALTATATTDVRQDVARQLGLQDPSVFVAGFARENLHYRVDQHRGKQAKRAALLEFLEATPGCGIIYASTRAACEEIRELVRTDLRREIIAYHGGLESEDRRRLQDDFMQGRAEIVAATNAFGMGIDKPDVRFVVHYNMPGSLEAYYQEAGRAGRDGQRSECLLLYSQNDRFIQEFFIDSAHPPQPVIKQVYDYLCRHPEDPIELTQQSLKQQLGLTIGADGVGTCERLLEKAGVLERLDSSRNMASVRVDTDAPNLAELLPKQAQSQRRVALAIGRLVGARRFERVYFHPRQLADSSGQDLNSSTRALRELSRHDWFDYVPPFRGRAVHMLRRDLPFEKLDVDYQRLEERRKLNLGKLDRVVRFALTRGCRQTDILRYFGDTSGGQCGHCDNCEAGAATGATKTAAGGAAAGEQFAVHADVAGTSPALLEITRMVLSGVARAQGRFGKQLVAAMLCGSGSAKVLRWKLDRLSTFGLLEDFKQAEVVEIMDALASLSLLKQVEVDKFRPTLHNTELGNDVMRGLAEMPGRLELDPQLRGKIESRYQRWQRAAARREQVSAGPSQHDGRERPVDSSHEEDCGSDRGKSSTPAVAAARGAVTPQPSHNPDDEIRPSYYWTWRLFRDGYSAAECAAIRRLGNAQLGDHLLQSIEDGLAVDPRWLLSDDQLRWLQEHAGDAARDITEGPDSPAGLSTEMVQLFRRCSVEALPTLRGSGGGTSG